MSEIADIATAVLTNHGLTGGLDKINNTHWMLRGERGPKNCCAVEFDGQPDEALLNQAAGMISAELDNVNYVGR